MSQPGYVRLPVPAFLAAFEAARHHLRSDPWAAHEPAGQSLCAYMRDWDRAGAELWPTDEYIFLPEQISTALGPWMPRR